MMISATPSQVAARAPLTLDSTEAARSADCIYLSGSCVALTDAGIRPLCECYGIDTTRHRSAWQRIAPPELQKQIDTLVSGKREVGDGRWKLAFSKGKKKRKSKIPQTASAFFIVSRWHAKKLARCCRHRRWIETAPRWLAPGTRKNPQVRTR